jgi:hypothetical protein
MTLTPEEAGKRLVARVQAKRAQNPVLPSLVDLETPPEFFRDHFGQLETWNAVEHVIAVFAGWQSGKTSTGPAWLLREIFRCGDGVYAILAPTYPLLRKGVLAHLLPFLRERFTEGEDYRFLRADMEIHILTQGQLKIWGEAKGETKILLVHANDPNSVEAFTALAMWIDEPGQLPDETWEAAQARVNVKRGRILLTSRPYSHNWYITKIWEHRDTDPKIKAINYSSIMNPAFDKEDYYRQKRILPPWKFRMKYDGIPTRPAGSIYDCFVSQWEDSNGEPLPSTYDQFIDEDGEERDIEMVGRNVCRSFNVPTFWRRSSGHDFGPRNTAAVFAAQNPASGKFYIYKSYHAGGKTTAGHIQSFRLRARTKQEPSAWGGASCEEKTRLDYSKHGWVIQAPPVADVIEGIMRVYSMIKTGLLVVFSELESLIQDFLVYSWKLDDNGDPLEDDAKNIDKKETYHRLDAVRYLCAAIYEGVTEILESQDRFGTSEEPLVYEDEEEMYNPYKHLGWKQTSQGWIQSGEEDEQEEDNDR